MYLFELLPVSGSLFPLWRNEGSAFQIIDHLHLRYSFLSGLLQIPVSPALSQYSSPLYRKAPKAATGMSAMESTQLACWSGSDITGK